MNYKIAKTMLVLCVVYLVGFYILKFIFPELLLQTITSPIVLRLNDFINIWIGFDYVFSFICSYLTYYLFACASSGKFKQRKFFFIFYAIITILTIVFAEVLPEFYTHTSICFMFLSAIVAKGKLTYATISFVLHGYLSQFLLSIRGFETIITQVGMIGAISCFILTLEAYVWLILLSIIFYIKERKNEQILSPVYQQTRQANGETISESGKERSES